MSELHLEKYGYPDQPGFKVGGTSRDAAKATASRASYLRDLILAAIVDSGWRGLTADQSASKVGVSILAARPRLSELHAQGKIIKTNERRPNSSGLSASVWIATTEGQIK